MFMCVRINQSRVKYFLSETYYEENEWNYKTPWGIYLLLDRLLANGTAENWVGRAYFEYAIRAEVVKHLRLGRAAFQFQTSED